MIQFAIGHGVGSPLGRVEAPPVLLGLAVLVTDGIINVLDALLGGVLGDPALAAVADSAFAVHRSLS